MQQKVETAVLKKVELMIEEGVDIIDIGAESSRPGSRPIDPNEEIKRLAPCVKLLKKEFKIPISVDTYKPKVIKAVLDSGASIINDITGLKDAQVKRLISRYNAGAIIMHMK